MKSGVICAISLVAVIGLSRCVVTECTAEEYVQWVESRDNGLHNSKTLNGYTFDLQYKPAEYVVLRENLELPSSTDEMNLETESISGMQYYTLRISREDGLDLLQDDVGSADEYSSRLVYFTGLMQQDIKLVDNGDTLPCLLFHFERTYGVDPRSTFLLGFDNSKNQNISDRTIVFDEHELGTGPVMITIEKECVENLPLLKLN